MNRSTGEHPTPDAPAASADAPLPETIEVLGARLTPFESYAHAEAAIAGLIRRGQRARCVALNPEKLYRAQRDDALRGLLGSAEIGICDGIGAALAARVLRGQRVRRCTGVDLFLHLAGAAERRGWRIFLLGAAPEVNAQAAAKLKADWPQLQIVGRRDGYFKDSAEVVAEINRSGAELLFVAMGSPKQEQWIWANWDGLKVPFCMGVGGTLDVVSGVKKRAPAWTRRLGLEFAYRLVVEPTRAGRQVNLIRFLVLLAAVKVGVRRELASPGT
jgi:N-acetylglucosaminyldiphosphoundecaprenol N-acetyl-beta-D-mannosaminyltransferase